MTATGIIASMLLAGGLLPPYYEIWKRRGESLVSAGEMQTEYFQAEIRLQLHADCNNSRRSSS